MGPQNAIVGDDYKIELPQTVVQEQDLVAERNAAKFSKSKEYKALKQYLESRIEFYQHNLPNGDLTSGATVEDWKVANLVIAEFRAVLDAYEQAREAVENVQRPRA